jgi:lysophospholipase L1-like esterase
VLGWCNPAWADERRAEAPPTDEIRADAAETPWGTYAALGDSYASGEGVPPFDGPCHRSGRAYPQLLSGLPGMPPATEFAACSGARIADLLPGRGQHGEAGQLEQLDADTALVTLSIGGNDLQFAKVLVACFVVRNCHVPIGPLARNLREHTDDRLVALYRDVLTRAPRARVVVVGYPRFVAASPNPLCRLVGLEPAEARWLNAETESTDATIRRSVEDIADPRLRYLSTLDAFAGGEACGSTGAYVSALVPRHLGYSFHPTAAGHARLAERLRPVLVP